ncbi:hypothetical protein [Paractinoplanes rishiriensis]|uniref:DUF5666 domain-containing protein n=1 Tax=Paractinoplanes rishiriensis TaxID=1050105 RepID=A0A919JT55_9ACTN|nr:hypothetical protein [Actinoplanes rishiriensis]GIE92882.1 hypothetical protein Ari01nite_03470 [Actinoplanes rishiriensis]
MRRTLVALGLTGVLALTGCGGGTADTAADVADAAVALQQVGFETAEAGQAPPRTLKKFLRKNTLHGEVAVQTRDNEVRTVVVQRGSVTAAGADSVSVRSSDGFALTWVLGDKLRVVQDRKQVEISAVKTGAEIGIAGVKDGDRSVARLIVIR